MTTLNPAVPPKETAASDESQSAAAPGNISEHSTPETEGPSSVVDSDEDTFERDLMNMLKTFPQQSPNQNGTAASSGITINTGGDVPPIFTPVTPPLTGQYPTPPSTDRFQGAGGGNMMRSQSMPLKSDLTRMIPSSAAVQETFSSVKKWSIATFKSTKQAVNEKLGRASRTVDMDLEKKIEILRNSQADYIELLQLSTKMSQQFSQLLATQKSMALLCFDLAVKQNELSDDFRRNADCQKAIVTNGEFLLKSLEQFQSSLETLVGQTIEDTLTTIREYESERLQFDAYRTEYEALNSAPQATATMARLHSVRESYEKHKTSYERLSEDVRVKLRFLDDNRVRVMHKQLMFFHNAVAAFFAGNSQQLFASTRHLSAPDEQQTVAFELQTWLEKETVLEKK